MTVPLLLPTVYARDEHVAIRAMHEWDVLCPDDQVLATGTDGAFAAGAPWTLTSASVSFATAGVAPGHVVKLIGPKPTIAGNGRLLAVDTVSAGSLGLRLVGKPAGVGQPYGPVAGVTGVIYKIKTLDPQIEDVSFEINRRFNIDAAFPNRAPSFIYGLDESGLPRDLRQLCVLTVLQRQLAMETRSDRGDYALKLRQVETDLTSLLERVTVRWGQLGKGEIQTAAVFNTRLTR